MGRDKNLTVESTWEGGYRCTVAARQFRIKIDEPDHAGSYPTGMSDIAFRAPEMLCAGFIACFYSELS